MSDKKISQLPSSTTPLSGTEELAVVQSGDTKKVSVANLTVGRDVTVENLTVSDSTVLGVPTVGVTSEVTINNRVGGIGNGLNIVNPIASVNGRGSRMNFVSSDTAIASVDGVVVTESTSGKLVFRSASSGSLNVVGEFLPTGDLSVSTGNLVIGTSGKGIDFSADGSAAGMTSELLDDYEEGTWTPSISGTGSNPDLVYTTQFGTYIKIGRAVHITGAIEVNSVTTPGSGLLRVDGLPFTAKVGTTSGEAGVIPVGRFQRTNNDLSGGVGFSLQTVTATGMYLYATPNTTSTAVAVPANEIKSLFTIVFGGTYFEDA